MLGGCCCASAAHALGCCAVALSAALLPRWVVLLVRAGRGCVVKVTRLSGRGRSAVIALCALRRGGRCAVDVSHGCAPKAARKSGLRARPNNRCVVIVLRIARAGSGSHCVSIVLRQLGNRLCVVIVHCWAGNRCAGAVRRHAAEGMIRVRSSCPAPPTRTRRRSAPRAPRSGVYVVNGPYSRVVHVWHRAMDG